MEKKTSKFHNFYRLCPAVHTLSIASALLILLHLATRQNHALMSALSYSIVQPLHSILARACSVFSFSVAELLIVVLSVAIIIRIIYGLVRIIRRHSNWRRCYRLFMGLISLGLALYALFSLLWGVYYYGDDFAARSGLSDEPVSTEQLRTVTEYFAALANGYSAKVERDENGLYVCDRDEIIEKSESLFDDIVRDFPCLDGPNVKVKPIFLSRGLSYLDFTGFFSPFTAEANVNTDFPPGLFASTVAHELSHQRGVAKEQEANFTAVLASFANGDADYCYSAALLAYTHLGNALYSADYEAWEEVYDKLDDSIKLDFACNRAYWKQFETPVQSVSNTVYEGLLYSYDQNLGLKSYGACVDLLVNYYYDSASEYLEANSTD